MSADDPHRAKDDFILRTYGVFSTSMLAVGAWGVLGQSSWHFWIAWFVLFCSFIRISVGAFSIYKYLFAMSNADLVKSEKEKVKWTDAESKWRSMRNVGPKWYLIGLLGFVSALISKFIVLN